MNGGASRKTEGSRRDPTPEEYATAVFNLDLPRGRKHPTAVKADQSQLDHVRSYDSLPEYYIDQPFECVECGRREIWRAGAQKTYYEEYKGHIDTQAIHCHECRRGRKRQAPKPE